MNSSQSNQTSTAGTKAAQVLVSHMMGPVLPATFIGLVSVNILYTLSSLISFTAQLFFTRRVGLISSKFKAVATICAVLLTVKMVASIVYMSQGLMLRLVISLYTSLHLALGCATAVDALLAASYLSVIIKHPDSRKRESSWIAIVTNYVINTGESSSRALIFLFSLATIIVASIPTVRWWWRALEIVTARLYSITLLSILNSRQFVFSRRVEVRGDGARFGRGIGLLARATHLATAERWDVPQLPAEAAPATFDIKVTTGTERYVDPLEETSVGAVSEDGLVGKGDVEDKEVRAGEV
ncbi:uncharacterized protein BXZ73DRAFT_100561 [Epithele typhae]|uniref:uncharacterized protein n=1 Tax=Epithele typhae TaxID=378194 RepID=UPI00200825D5|nr:uncharacterized protein BXZ73DRAFT_100561 [Epithele typhae]KAH9935174.1 hypothetical protein BXZ73DRAFT_100561 [Epithele typhae]